MTRSNEKYTQKKNQGVLQSSEAAPSQAVVASMVGALSLLMSTAASAQTAPAESKQVELDEIIVTANKIAEPVQKVTNKE